MSPGSQSRAERAELHRAVLHKASGRVYHRWIVFRLRKDIWAFRLPLKEAWAYSERFQIVAFYFCTPWFDDLCQMLPKPGAW